MHPLEKKFSTAISDGSKKTYDITITLDKSENLVVESILNKDTDEGKDSFTLKLKRTKHHRNGFVQYAFKTEDIPAGRVEEFKTILVKDIYHIAKQFYHQHEADSGKDAALRAVITDKPGGIDDDDNVFLIGFLKNYTPVFEEYAKNISDANGRIQNREKRISAIENKEKDSASPRLLPFKESILKRALKINELCENACIEYTYCKTLLSSLHNKSFIHNLKIVETDGCDPEEKKEWRRCALNIRNAMRYIENIKYKNQNRLNKLVQLLLKELNSVTEEVKSSTNVIKLALQQGKRSERMNYTLAYLSIYISFMLGFPIKEFIPFEYKFPYVGVTLGTLFYIVVCLGLLIFMLVLMRQKRSKIPQTA